MHTPVPGPLALCLLAALLFGASTPAAKVLLSEFGPITLAGLLYLGAAFGIAPFARRGGDAGLRRRPRELRLLAGAVVFGGVLGPVLLLAGLVRAPAGTTSLWLLLETVATTLLAAAFFREHVGVRAWIALAVILGGGIALAGPTGGAFAPDALPAFLLVALACVCWGFDNNWTALIGGFTPAQTTLVKAAVAGSVNLGIGLLVEPPHPGPAGWGALATALLVGALAYGASIAFYVRGAQQVGAIRSQLVFSTAPFLGLVVSWLFLREPVLPAQVGAGIGMAAGVLLLSTSRHGHEHVHEALEHTHAHRHDDDHHDHAHPGLSPGISHTHAHVHGAIRHAHPHAPDLHHRHDHRVHSGG